jgi:hypothetical protein
MDLHELEDKFALKELVDNISFLGDKKDYKNQVLLFSEKCNIRDHSGRQNHFKIAGQERNGDNV